MSVRGKSYVWLKIAKAQLPVVNRVRLLKTEPKADAVVDRPIVDVSLGNDRLYECVAAAGPFAAGKIGDTELEVILKYEQYAGDERAFFEAISDGHELDLLCLNCGVFPKRKEVLVRWVAVYLEALHDLDLLGVWHNRGEKEVVATHAHDAMLTGIKALEPYYHEAPWSRALAGKRVVIVTPFVDSISLQYARHRGDELFPNSPTVLPDFSLNVVKSPFSAALVPPAHVDWHAALDDLKLRLVEAHFDVCLIGAGAWSLPLCSFVKRTLRRPAIHMGGALQILFGVRGRRWEHHPVIREFFNDKWIRPLPHERPKSRRKNDGGAYW